MSDPFNVVRDFEAALCEYTGAPYAVAVNSCTMALLLSVAWSIRQPEILGSYGSAAACSGFAPKISIPKRTYVSVPQSIIHAGGVPTFRDEEWRGIYQLYPLKVYDSARWFTRGMYEVGDGMLCVSFHHSKILGDTQGGAILHDNPEADKWLRKARFDGRTEGVAPKDDKFDMIGWHCYMSPDVASRLLWKMSKLPLHNDPLTNDPYPDLSKLDIFNNGGNYGKDGTDG